MNFERVSREVAQKKEMNPRVRAGEKRRVDEEDPRSLIRGAVHEIWRVLLETLGK